MKKIDIEMIYPLSPMQQGMLFHSLYAPGSGVYLEQLSCDLQGDLDVSALTRAFQRLVERYPVLRTSFVWKRLEQTVQVVHRRVDVPLEVQDWTDRDHAQQEAALAAYLDADRARGFDLSRPPLLRIALLRRSQDVYRLVWTYHHLLLDGWSMPILLQNLATFYNAERAGEAVQLPHPPAYREYIAWLQQQDPAQAEAFWRSYLAGFSGPTSLAGSLIERPAAPGQESTGPYEDQVLSLSQGETEALQAFARRHQLTLNVLVQAAWALLLSRYTREQDVLFGATASGRPTDLAGVESMVGLLINTLPVRVRIRPEQAVLPWLKEIQARQAEYLAYSHSPLIKIQEWSEIRSGVALFESLVVFENYPVEGSAHQLEGVQIRDLRSIEHTNYPVTLIASARAGLVLKLSYDRAQADPSAIRRALGHLHTLLHGMLETPFQPVGRLGILTPDERQQTLTDWNATRREFPTALYAQQYFEQQAGEHPDRPALLFGEQQVSYRELDRRANQLAGYLQMKGARADSLVGICAERSIEMIVAVLGVLKAGAAFLPLDPAAPPNRLAFMLQDADAPLLLTQSHLLPTLPATGAQIVCLDRDWERIAAQQDQAPACPSGPANLAYVIYTSGSTGQPKGVLLEHRGLCNLIQVQVEQFQVDSRSRVLQFASFSFDAAVSEIFMALSSGAALVLAPQETLSSVPDLVRLIDERQVSVVTLPPTLLALLDPRELPGIQTLISAGEACPLELAERWSNGRLFLNGYGPTETTVQAASYRISDLPPGARRVPIGKPVPNSQVYVLDPDLQPVPVGIPGELHVSGINVGRGYLNRPELTAERFIPDPFQAWTSARMYKTGDLVRWLPDGNLEYLGRTDQQVKIRGFRVELGEIENTLLGHPAIDQAAVVARDIQPGDRRLVAYLVSEAGPDGAALPTTADLRAFLRQTLPDYMLPAAFVFLARLPLTPSGKVDRKALPDPDGPQAAGAAESLPARTPTEQILAGLWERLLAVHSIGGEAHFFELGGHSLLATQLGSRIRDAFGVELPLRTIFEFPVLADLARQIDLARGRQPDRVLAPLRPVARGEPLPLSFSQQRLWFLDQLEPGNPYYNLPAAVRMKGRIVPDALQRSLDHLAGRHEILRTNLGKDRDGKPWQFIRETAAITLEIVDLSATGEPETREQTALSLAEAETRRPFLLDSGSLLRAVLYRLDEQDAFFVLIMHHVIADAWSMRVMVEELAATYAAFECGQAPRLAELPVQYADYAVWQREWLQGEDFEQQLAYWKDQLAGLPPLLDLPTDRPRPAVQSFRGGLQQFQCGENLRETLRSVCQKEGVTPYMFLLAVYQVLLYRYSGQTDIPIGTALANRERSELERLIGFFVNTLVLRADLSGEPSFRELLGRVRETCLDAYAHQDLPFEMLVDHLQVPRSLSHSPIFQAAFNYQASPQATISLPGLTLDLVPLHNGSTSFDLLFNLGESPGGLTGGMEYNTDLYDGATIHRMLRHYQALLEAALAMPDQPITRLEMLAADERGEMLVEWNATQTQYSSERCAQHLFEEQARRNPENTALELDGGLMSYRELNARANHLAEQLSRQGIGLESLVAVCVERSFDLVVAALGIMKAGAAYLPLDPSYPPERLGFMLADSGAGLLLTQTHLDDRLPRSGVPVLYMDRDLAWDGTADGSDFSGLAGPRNLAYVIYTSGSTGRPKGALLEHRGLCNLIEVQRQAFDLEPGRRVLQFASSSFDASVWEIFMALGNGATLVLARQEVLASPPDLLRLLKEAKITHATLPPSMLEFLPAGDLPDLEVLVAAGEACPAELVARWGRGRRFFNAYGPTETTVCASMTLCDPYDPQPPPIGRPIGNMRLYVLDAHQQLLPPGIPGELCVAGVGVGRGYLNRPELTAQKFLLNPFGAEPGDRLYRTGDRVTARPDGNIEFIGRMDDQVKLRGFRIELGEIEAGLLEQPGVRQAAVVVRAERLVAFIVFEEPTAVPTPEDLRRSLRAQLPEYMLPAGFIFLDSLPLTPNGKIDRAHLPDLEEIRLEANAQTAFLAPRTATEAALVDICRDLLHVDPVSAGANFFELGGHSLLATQFFSRVREVFSVELPLRTLFEQPVIRDLAACIDQARQSQPEDVAKRQESVLDTLQRVNAMTPDQVEEWLARSSPDREGTAHEP